ncbi:GNAT N-acetyltransferase [Leucobacter coleopterorum]|uniref:GNAT N-acetyltransferase n=1 Tax=Leucobacter coleopterorum TaxID=2714933 RepID=A0ABX6JY75_9MICO|nr:GNAT family N-acetyltransferase [Leucobacter coleopterorum]QIM18901.1 GNAT N-acetyltransferase [Leucobacter coleopterorum]
MHERAIWQRDSGFGSGALDPKDWSRQALAQHPLRTERLTIRPLEASDADDVWRYQKDAEILRYIPWPERTRAEAREHTERRASSGELLKQDGDHVFLAVELAAGPEAGRVIGDLMLRVSNTVKAEIEVGWVFASDQQGKGYAAEASAEAIRLAFEQLEAHRVVAHLDDRNTASAALCTRLGMRHEGTAFAQEWEPDGWVNLELYALDHEEWSCLDSGSPQPRAASPTPVPPTVASEGAPSPFLLPYDFAGNRTLPLHTERLELRAYRESDGAELWALMSDPAITHYLSTYPRNLTETSALAHKNAHCLTLDREGDAVKAVIAADGVFAGQIKLQVASVELHVLEVGWTVAPSFQGRGFAREAATALLDVAFEKIGAHRVIANLDPCNRPSAALATRLGMRPEQVSRLDWPEANNRWVDNAVYAITAAEWRARVK